MLSPINRMRPIIYMYDNKNKWFFLLMYAIDYFIVLCTISKLEYHQCKKKKKIHAHVRSKLKPHEM